MKQIDGKSFCKIIERKGWSLARITGSHHIYVKAGVNVRITVPVHGGRDLKIGLLRALMKMAEVSDDDL